MIEITRNYGAKTLRMFVEDGSVLIKIIKQYNTSPVGDYLN